MSEVPFTSPPETLPQCHFPDPAAPPAGSVPDLSGWFHALEGARAPSAGASQVIPLGFGGPASVDDAAWLGDKHLGIAVADVLVAHGVHGKEDLTRRHSALVSNYLSPTVLFFLRQRFGGLFVCWEGVTVS